MSDHIWMDLPTGRKLEQPGNERGYTGSIGPLRRADKPSLRLARRSLREIPEDGIEGVGKYLVEKATGEEFEVVTSFVDLIDPKLTGTTAFCVRDSYLVPLRPVGWKNDADESKYAGEFYGREATGSDALPMPITSGIF